MIQLIKNINKIILLSTLIILNPISHSKVVAQDITKVLLEIPSSINPVGSGSRSLGMGGAFIAVADDATAASWNPGALLQLERPEISIVQGYVHRKEGNRFTNNPESQAVETIDKSSINYLSVVSPHFEWKGYHMIASINYQHLYDFSRNWDLLFNDTIPGLNKLEQIYYEQDGALYALGVSLCAKIFPDFSAGLTLNYWGDVFSKNRWTQRYLYNQKIILNGNVGFTYENKKEIYSFSGENIVMGFRWKINENWVLGGVFKSSFKADIDHQIIRNGESIDESDPQNKAIISQKLNDNKKLKMPMSYGLGVSYCFYEDFNLIFSDKYSNELTLSGDFYVTQWDDFYFETPQGVKISPISGKNLAQSNISPTTWFRLGVEYLIISQENNFTIPLRAGVFYDPAPAEKTPDNYYGFSLGSGLAYKRYVFDIAYQFRFGDDVGKSSLQTRGFSQKVREHTIFSSLIIHF